MEAYGWLVVVQIVKDVWKYVLVVLGAQYVMKDGIIMEP